MVFIPACEVNARAWRSTADCGKRGWTLNQGGMGAIAARSRSPTVIAPCQEPSPTGDAEVGSVLGGAACTVLGQGRHLPVVRVEPLGQPVVERVRAFSARLGISRTVGCPGGGPSGGAASGHVVADRVRSSGAAVLVEHRTGRAHRGEVVPELEGDQIRTDLRRGVSAAAAPTEHRRWSQRWRRRRDGLALRAPRRVEAWE